MTNELPKTAACSGETRSHYLHDSWGPIKNCLMRKPCHNYTHLRHKETKLPPTVIPTNTDTDKVGSSAPGDNTCGNHVENTPTQLHLNTR